MKVFIFGAGASYGCLPDGCNPAFRAPLVDDLFDNSFLSNCAPLSPAEFKECELAVKSCGSLEQWLTDRWDTVRTLKQPTSRSGEQAFFGRVTFYVWGLLQQVSFSYASSYSGATAYRDFLSRLKAKDEEFSLISFNYDTLLDSAFEYVCGRMLMSIEDYALAALIKPHGSVNWLIPMRSSESGSRPGNSDVNLQIATSRLYDPAPMDYHKIQVFSPSDGGIHGFSNASNLFRGRYFYPALFMPLTTKLYRHIEGFYEGIILRGKVYLSKASEIYLIGYRAADEVIRDMFQDVPRGTKLDVVGSNDAPQVMKAVMSWAPTLVEGSLHTEGFWEFAQHF